MLLCQGTAFWVEKLVNHLNSETGGYKSHPSIIYGIYYSFNILHKLLSPFLRSDELVFPTPVEPPPPNKSGMTTALEEATAAFWRWFDAKELKERKGTYVHIQGEKSGWKSWSDSISVSRSKSPTSTMTCSKVLAWSLWSMEDSAAPKTDREFETCPFSLTQFVLHRNWSFWRHFSLKWSLQVYLVIFCWHFQGWKLCWARNVDMRNL